MIGRLLVGILKGLVLGALVGFGLVKIGMAFPGAVVAYLAAAVTGVLIGLIAGKPIWAKDAKIEAGMKAVVGAILGAGLMFAARKWLGAQVPAGLLTAVHVDAPADAATATMGYFGMTSLAAIAGLLGGFYDADNTPEPEKAEGKTPAPPATKKRIAEEAAEDEDLDEELLDESEKKKGKK